MESKNKPSIKKFRFSTNEIKQKLLFLDYKDFSVIDNKMDLSVKELLELFETMSSGRPALDVFRSTGIRDYFFRSLMKYSEKERKIIKNILLCCRRWKKYSCIECDYEVRTIFRCHDRYCTCDFCVMTRFAKALEKLYSLGIRSKRGYHFTIGSNLMDKATLQSKLNRYINRMRKPTQTELNNGVKTYKLNYIKVFDISKKNSSVTGKTYNHFHYWVMGEDIPIAKFIARSQYVLKKIDNDINFWGIGWRYKTGIYRYFAKRIAGIFGHEENHYFLKDIMNLKTYLTDFYRSKFLSWSSPEGFLNNYAFSVSGLVCPIHKIPLLPDGFDDVDRVLTGLDYPPAPPPPKIMENEDVSPIKKPLCADFDVVVDGYDLELFDVSKKWDNKSFIDNLYYDVGKQATNFRVCNTFLNNGVQLFSKWRYYMDIQGTMFLTNVNQREQINNEIILDCDKPKYNELIKRLKHDNIKFYAYATTHGRAQHIHCYFKGLAELNKKDREFIREKFIVKYGGDIMFKIDTHMVAMEFCEHWKTKEVKNLIDYNAGINTIFIKEHARAKEQKDFEDYLKPNMED